MSNAERPSKTGLTKSTARVGFVERRVDDRDSTKKKVIQRLKDMAPSLVASGTIVDARRSPLETPPPRRRRGDLPEQVMAVAADPGSSLLYRAAVRPSVRSNHVARHHRRSEHPGRAQTEEPLADLITKKAKLSVSYVSMMERGERKPTLDTLEALAKALGVPPLDLLQGRRARR